MWWDGVPGASREVLVVLALAVTGLLLAALAAFNPWYARPAGAGRSAVTELRAPAPPAVSGELTVHGGLNG